MFKKWNLWSKIRCEIDMRARRNAVARDFSTADFRSKEKVSKLCIVGLAKGWIGRKPARQDKKIAVRLSKKQKQKQRRFTKRCEEKGVFRCPASGQKLTQLSIKILHNFLFAKTEISLAFAHFQVLRVLYKFSVSFCSYRTLLLTDLPGLIYFVSLFQYPRVRL